MWCEVREGDLCASSVLTVSLVVSHSQCLDVDLNLIYSAYEVFKNINYIPEVAIEDFQIFL